MDKTAPGIVSFEALDALLDQAYALEGPARREFVEGLPAPQREQIGKLLELSNALTLSDIAADPARSVAKTQEPSEESPLTADAGAEETPAGRWRLHRELGSGGMGQVFFASREAHADTASGSRDYVQEAAIKILWSHRASEDVRARFLRERRLLASLDHPGLARFVDGGFLADGRPWFAMEYVAGTTIDEYVRDQSLEERLRLFLEVCAAVAYAHQRLIVHRDIKPQNVLVDETGRARLLDFGVAGVLDDIDDGVYTRTAGAPLTLQYASPEQLTGAMVTVASDVYQLGLLLYVMLTGAPPYDVSDLPLTEAIDVICNTTPAKPGVRDAAIGSDLDAIVMAALSKSPDERYRTVSALADDVSRFLEDRPVKAMPRTAWYVARRFLRRNALVTGIVTASALALTAATVVSVRMADEAAEQAARSATAQQILSDVFRKADPFQGRGATVTLADALTRALPEIEARVADDPLLAWEVNHELGKIFESLGLIEQEAAAHRAVLAAAAELGDESEVPYLWGVAGLGNVLARTNPAEAVKFFDERLPARPTDAAAVEPWMSAQYSYVGALNRVREFGRADAGTFVMAEIVQQYDVDDPRRRARLSQLLAGVARRAGDAATEDRHWSDAVRHMRAANNPSALAVTLSNRAIFLGRSARYDESEAAFLESLAIFEEAGMDTDATFATVLRGYAGLLFRSGRAGEAITTTERALKLLDPGSQFYARFVAEVNLAQYSLVTGDTSKTLVVMTRALPVVRREFADDPSIGRRMQRLFGKTMVFGGAYAEAAMAIGYADGECRREADLLRALESLEHPADEPARQKVWAALADLRHKSRSEELTQPDLDGFVALYEQEAPVFFDALDQWRVLDALSSTAVLPPALRQRHAELDAQRAETATLIAAYPAGTLVDLAAYLRSTADKPVSCLQTPPG